MKLMWKIAFVIPSVVKFISGVIWADKLFNENCKCKCVSFVKISVLTQNCFREKLPDAITCFRLFAVDFKVLNCFCVKVCSHTGKFNPSPRSTLKLICIREQHWVQMIPRLILPSRQYRWLNVRGTMFKTLTDRMSVMGYISVRVNRS